MTKPIPKEKVDKIFKLHREGLRPSQIAKKIGVHKVTVLRYLKKKRDVKYGKLIPPPAAHKPTSIKTHPNIIKLTDKIKKINLEIIKTRIELARTLTRMLAQYIGLIPYPSLLAGEADAILHKAQEQLLELIKESNGG